MNIVVKPATMAAIITFTKLRVLIPFLPGFRPISSSALRIIVTGVQNQCRTAYGF
jgi:hypothetical protein